MTGTTRHREQQGKTPAFVAQCQAEVQLRLRPLACPEPRPTHQGHSKTKKLSELSNLSELSSKKRDEEPKIRQITVINDNNDNNGYNTEKINSVKIRPGQTKPKLKLKSACKWLPVGDIRRELNEIGPVAVSNRRKLQKEIR